MPDRAPRGREKNAEQIRLRTHLRFHGAYSVVRAKHRGGNGVMIARVRPRGPDEGGAQYRASSV